MSIIKEVFPTAEIEAEANNSSEVKVVYNKSTEVVKVAQRDLYRKYRWPAEPKVRQMLELLKEEMEG